MNEFQAETFILQAKGLWYLSFPTDKIPYEHAYFDGIKVKNGKVVNPKKSPNKKEEFLLKQIQKYCKRLKDLPKLPEPNGGDCWYCSFQGEDHKTMGDIAGNDHLKSHLKEMYIHGSLIWNALRSAGHQDPEVIFQMDVRDSIVRAVRKYFKTQLGLVA